MSTSSRWLCWVIRGLLAGWIVVSVMLLCLMLAEQLCYSGETGYGDAPIYHSILLMKQTGRIYPDPLAPETFGFARSYGPLFYVILYAGEVVGGWRWGLDVMRALVLLAFLSGSALVAQLGRSVLPVRLGWGLTAVTALAIQVIRPWATQLRGDFFAIALNVTSLVVIAGEGRPPMLLAALGGIAAGLAPCIKLSYVAGAVSGVIWLLWERQWRRAFIFMTAGGITAVTIYGVTGWHEPLLWLHMTMLRKAVLPDHAGQLALFLAILRDPLIVVALTTGVIFGRWWRRSRCCLLLIYIIITTCIAITTSAHAGANLNYYLEPSMALMPLTVVGGLCLWRFAGRPASSSGRVRMVLWSGVALAMALGILPWCVQEMASLSASQRRIEARNQRFNRLRQLRGLRILSFSPDATLATAAAQIEDPWALSLFSIRGIIRLDPLVDRIVAKEFDVVIIDRQHTGYRGVPTIAAELGVVISKHYVPKCEVLGAVVCVRRPAGSRGDIRIAEGIRKVGCL